MKTRKSVWKTNLLILGAAVTLCCAVLFTVEEGQIYFGSPPEPEVQSVNRGLDALPGVDLNTHEIVAGGPGGYYPIARRTLEEEARGPVIGEEVGGPGTHGSWSWTGWVSGPPSIGDTRGGARWRLVRYFMEARSGSCFVGFHGSDTFVPISCAAFGD